MRDYPKGSRFDLVVESGEITENTQSVPLDFRSKTLDFDGDYVAAKNSTSTLLPTIIVVGLAGAFCLTMGIIAVTKSKKKEEVGTSTQTIVDETETKLHGWYGDYNSKEMDEYIRTFKDSGEVRKKYEQDILILNKIDKLTKEEIKNIFNVTKPQGGGDDDYNKFYCTCQRKMLK